MGSGEKRKPFGSFTYATVSSRLAAILNAAYFITLFLGNLRSLMFWRSFIFPKFEAGASVACCC